MDIIQTMVMSRKNKENENKGGPAWLFFTEKTGCYAIRYDKEKHLYANILF